MCVKAASASRKCFVYSSCFWLYRAVLSKLPFASYNVWWDTCNYVHVALLHSLIRLNDITVLVIFSRYNYNPSFDCYSLCWFCISLRLIVIWFVYLLGGIFYLIFLFQETQLKRIAALTGIGKKWKMCCLEHACCIFVHLKVIADIKGYILSSSNVIHLF